MNTECSVVRQLNAFRKKRLMTKQLCRVLKVLYQWPNMSYRWSYFSVYIILVPCWPAKKRRTRYCNQQLFIHTLSKETLPKELVFKFNQGTIPFFGWRKRPWRPSISSLCCPLLEATTRFPLITNYYKTQRLVSKLPFIHAGVTVFVLGHSRDGLLVLLHRAKYATETAENCLYKYPGVSCLNLMWMTSRVSLSTIGVYPPSLADLVHRVTGWQESMSTFAFQVLQKPISHCSGALTPLG